MAKHDDINKYGFKATTRVRMSQTDIEGIVNNIRFFDFIEIGRFEYFRNIGVIYGDLKKFGSAMALADLSCKFLSPLYFDEIIDVHTRMDFLGNSSFHIRYLLRVPERDVIVAEGRTVSVFLDPRTRKPMSMPEDFRKVILDFEGAENVNTRA